MDSVLSSRDALDNIAEIRKRIESEKSVVDGQLQAAVEAQSNLLATGMASLTSARKQIKGVRDSIKGLHATCEESSDSVKDFPQIERLHLVSQNFDLVEAFVNNFKTLEHDLQEINAMMDDPRGQYNGDGGSFEFMLPIHAKLNKLREVQHQALKYAASSSEDTRITIKGHFAPLNAAHARFEKYFFEVPQDALELCQSDPSLLVRLAKVVDFEERKDLLSEKSAEASFRPLSNYPKRMMDQLAEMVEMKFNAYAEQFDDREALIKNINWVFRDLKLVQRYVVPLMPSRWKILNLMIKWYHKGVYNLLNSLTDDATAGQILEILEFSKRYYSRLKELFGVEKSALEPPLLDGQEKGLYDEFLSHLVEKLHEWYKTVAVQEKRPFVQRSTAPDSLDGILYLSTHTDMNRLVSQQLNTAAESNQGRIVLGCVDACCDLLMQRQREWCDLIDQEVTKEIKGTVEEVPPGLFEYLIALANEQDRGQEFLDDLAQKWTETLSRKYQSQALEKFDEATDGFIEVARKCIGGMISLISNDLQKAYANMFTTKEWRKGITIEQITRTLSEYLDEASTVLLPELFVTLVERLCRASVLQCLRCMSNAQGKLKGDEGAERLVKDAEELFSVFSKEEYGVEHDVIADMLQVFAFVCDTLKSPVEELPMVFQSLREKYWDSPLDLFETMVGLRKDMDKKTVRDIMSKVRMATVQNRDDPEKDRQPTFLHGFK